MEYIRGARLLENELPGSLSQLADPGNGAALIGEGEADRGWMSRQALRAELL